MESFVFGSGTEAIPTSGVEHSPPTDLEKGSLYAACSYHARMIDMVERTQSDELHMLYLEAQSRFDQFVMGATLAVCAYLAQSNPYEKLGWNLPTLYFASLLLFAAAALCGFKRIEQVVQTLRHNTDLLEAQEKGIKDRVKEARAASHRASKQTHYFYLARNTFLFLGLITYIAAKVLGPYVSS